MEEGFEYDYDLPSLSETQREKNKELIKEINDARISYPGCHIPSR